jgi:multisubunit Na+/H+ antiporter MnhG subunit
MPGVGVSVLVVALLCVAAPLALYWLVRAERDRGEPMARRDAERVARRDTEDERRR